MESVILPAGSRAPRLPEDTASVPLIALTRGWLQEDASAGTEVQVTTMSGRTVRGTLTGRPLAPVHGYGDFIPELQEIHCQVRDLLFGGEK
ncbi:MAG TPA: 2-amino-4-ketopentanoate thiolase [Clostridiaceae bacterium]|nr:2-amino-4-ketopentanoate thiolase [Clostridiaceae bacterium]